MIWLTLIILIWCVLLGLIPPLLRAQPTQTDQQTSSDTTPSRKMVAIIAGLFVASALGIYSSLGSPELFSKTQTLPDSPTSSPDSPSELAQNPAIMTFMEEIESALEGERQNDPAVWIIHARSLIQLGEYDKAFRSYEQALALSDNNAEIATELDRARQYVDMLSRSPTQADIQTAQDLSPQERQDLIEGMVNNLADRLYEEPDNPEGWIKLLKSRHVLDQIQPGQMDIEHLSSYYAQRPDVISYIINQAGWPHQDLPQTTFSSEKTDTDANQP